MVDVFRYDAAIACGADGAARMRRPLRRIPAPSRAARACRCLRRASSATGRSRTCAIRISSRCSRRSTRIPSAGGTRTRWREKLVDVEEVVPALALPPHEDGRADHRPQDAAPAARRASAILQARARPRVLSRADRRAHGDRREVTRQCASTATSRDRRRGGRGPRARRRSTKRSCAAHIAPLFSRVLAAQRDRIYLANHSLGRPLDATADDVREGLAAWYARHGRRVGRLGGEMAAYRARLAALIGAPRADCIVPKTSAGQGLRAVLNTYDTRAARGGHARRVRFARRDPARVRAARAHRAHVRRAATPTGCSRRTTCCAAIGRGADLVVVSQVMFQTGPGAAGAAGDRRGGARGGRARAARRLSLARRVPGRHRGARRRLRGRRQLQVSARRPGRVLPLRRIRAISTRGLAHARHRLVREGGAVHATRVPIRRAMRRAATPGSNRRRRCCRSTRRAPGSASRWRSASRACAPIRCELQRRLVRCSPSAASRRRAAPTDRGAFVVVRHRAARCVGRRARRSAASSPTRAANGCACARTC